jgi:hypothetical protein
VHAAPITGRVGAKQGERADPRSRTVRGGLRAGRASGGMGARPAAAAVLSDLSDLSVLGRFNSLIVGLNLPVRPIYFPVRPRREFALEYLEISMA